jgi:hypothetical protein
LIYLEIAVPSRVIENDGEWFRDGETAVKLGLELLHLHLHLRLNTVPSHERIRLQQLLTNVLQQTWK